MEREIQQLGGGYDASGLCRIYCATWNLHWIVGSENCEWVIPYITLALTDTKSR